MTTALLLLLAAASPIAGPQAEVTTLVDRFLAAERAYDAAALARLVTPDFVEISPIGEVDGRDRFLSFYTPDKRQPAPDVAVDERGVRLDGDTAIVTMRLSYGPASLRAVFVARRRAGGWALASTQFTPIRPPRAP